MEYSFDGMYGGKIDTDNVHQYYTIAAIQNKKNLEYLQKVKIKITIKSNNFNLYRFQKINMKFYKIKEMVDNKGEDNLEVTPENIEKVATEGSSKDEKKLNQRLSGEWLITSIDYSFNKVSDFLQEVTLVKRELSFNENDFDPDKTY